MGAVALGCPLMVGVWTGSWRWMAVLTTVYVGVTVLEKVAYANAVLAYKSVIRKLRGQAEEAEGGGGTQAPSQGEVERAARGLLEAFARGDRDAAERLLAEDFRFSSPDDPELDRAGWFERCWPGSELARGFRVEQLVVEGEQAFVQYRAEFEGRAPFRNTERIVVRDGRVRRVEVYYGASEETGAGEGG